MRFASIQVRSGAIDHSTGQRGDARERGEREQREAAVERASATVHHRGCDEQRASDDERELYAGEGGEIGAALGDERDRRERSAQEDASGGRCVTPHR